MDAEVSSIFDPRHYAKVMRPSLEAEPLPAWCYTSESFHAREQERIFLRSWLCIGRADALPGPGDYRTIELGEARIVVLRDRTGGIRALSNVCRHRGMLLLEGRGTVSAISCPFHGWSYALDGRLRAAPRMDETPGFDKGAYGLPGYEVALWQGFVFIRLEPGGPGLEEAMGDMDGLMAPYDLAGMGIAREKRFTVRCNWKLFLDVFMEDYHVQPVHRHSIAGTYSDPEPQQRWNGDFATTFDRHAGTSALLTEEQHLGLPPIAGLSGLAAAGTRYTLLYPSFAFACTVDCMWFFEIYPRGPSRTEVVMTMCFPRATLARDDFAARFARYDARWEVSMAEDVAVLERQQQGMASGQYLPGRYSTLEPVVGQFAAWVIRHAVGDQAGSARA